MSEKQSQRDWCRKRERKGRAGEEKKSVAKTAVAATAEEIYRIWINNTAIDL